MELGVDLDAIVLDQIAAGLVVALARDPLDLTQQLAKELAQRLVVSDDEVGLAVLVHPLDNILLEPLLVDPLGHQLSVSHMGLLEVLPQRETPELPEQTVADEVVVHHPPHILRRHDTDLDQLGIQAVVERDQIRPRLLERVAIVLERLVGGPDTLFDLARGMADDFVHVRMEIRGQGTVELAQLDLFVRVAELLQIAALFGSLVVGLHEIAERDRLRTVVGADPVGVGQIDADRRGG